MIDMAVSWVLPDELKQLAETDEALIEEVLSVFRTDTAERIGRMQEAVDRGDFAAVKAEAHTLKGSSGQVGAAAVSALCRQIEQRAPEGDAATMQELVAQLQKAFDSVCREMSA